MKPIANAVIAGLAIVASGFAVKEWLASQEAAEVAAATVVRRTALTKEAHRLKQRLDETESESSKLERELSVLRLKPAAPKQAQPASSAPAPARRAPVVEAIIDDPKLQNLRLAARRASLSATYGPLFEQLGLSPEQIDKFKNLLIARDEKRMDTLAIREANSLSKDDAALARFNEQADAELAGDEKTLLGEPGYAELMDYRRSLPAREAVDSFAGKAAVAGAALTPAQAEQLTRILAQTSPAFRAGGSVDAVNWSEALNNAGSTLNRIQTSVLRGTSAPDEYMEQIKALAAQPSAKKGAAREGVTH